MKHATLSALFSAIAEAIRGKTGGTDTLIADDFPDAIAAIDLGTDTADADAAGADLLAGKTAYARGAKLTGAIPVRTAGEVTVSGREVSVPAGYYAAQVQKSVAAAAQATPGITVSAAGLITASVTQAAGYVAAGTKSATKQLATQAARTITPGTATQAINPGRYLTGTLNILGDSDLVPANIKSGVTIFGVYGTCGKPASVSVTITNKVTNRPIQVYRPFWSGGKLTVSGTRIAEGSTQTLSVAAPGDLTGPMWLVIASVQEQRSYYSAYMTASAVDSAGNAVEVTPDAHNYGWLSLTLPGSAPLTVTVTGY